MVIEQTVDIPADRQIERLHLDLPMPQKYPSGKVRVLVSLTPKAPLSDDVGDTDSDTGISASPPDFEEFCRLCEQAKQLNIPNFYTCEEILEEAAKRSNGMQALEYRRGAQKIRYWLSHQELWDETTRSVRKTREEWDDPWQAAQ